MSETLEKWVVRALYGALFVIGWMIGGVLW